jgi:hypothetical protein
MSSVQTQAPDRFEVRFNSLFRPGRAVSFPCDASGVVDLDALPEPARRNYLSACRQVGSEYATPRVCAALRSPGGPTWH